MPSAGTTTAARDYGAIEARVRAARPANRQDAMQAAVDAFWDELGAKGVSWIGFYEKLAGSDQMILTARRDKPACSPIGLHGMCGRGYLDRRALLIPDVRTLGENYIACDPKDQSEAVIPVFDADGTCWGVLDADSYDRGSFTEADITGMRRVLVALGLTHPRFETGPTLTL